MGREHCAPSFETRSRAAPQRVRMFRSCAENFVFDGLEDGDRGAFRLNRHRMTAKHPDGKPVLAAWWAACCRGFPWLCR
jgi:hypothetical protein